MQAAEENSITVVEPTVGDTYSDTNLNEKDLGTQYIYTTEGELIPASEDPPEANLEITAEHYNSEPQNIHIEQVDYQYDEQYSTSTVETVVTETEYVQESTYISESVTEEQTTVTETQPEIEAQQDVVIEQEEVVEPEETVTDVSEPSEKLEEVSDSIEPEGHVLESLKDNPVIEIQQQDESVEEASDSTIETEDSSLTIDTSINKDDTIEILSMEVDEDEKIQEEPQKKSTEFSSHSLEESIGSSSEPIVNGKSSKQRPGARIGVKVPPRNLTSRIVSRTEIENEIIERARKKEQSIVVAEKRSVFSKKSYLGAKKDKQSTTPKSKNDSMDVDNNANEEKKTNGKSKNVIHDNSDLLAILEGNDDTDDIPTIAPQLKAKESTPTDETNLKNLEREIALQQLNDLPFLAPKTKVVKPLKYKASTPEKPVKIHIISSSPIKSDNESQVKVNMTLKTYSRKRKSTENVPSEILTTPAKKIKEKPVEVKPVQTSTPVEGTYVTKSSRIIKKKVIWDPDESPLKQQPRISIKAETTPKPTTPASHPKREERSADAKKSADAKPKEDKSEAKAKILPKSEVKVKISTDMKAKADKKAKEKTPVKKIPAVEKKKPVTVEKRASLANQGKPKAKKPKSEVDRLLGDEGAIKMLYELKSDRKPENEQRRGTIRIDRTFKELAKKANQIKSDLENTSSAETPKNLRKKEPNLSPLKASPVSPVPASINRQKSKDSIRSNTTPPRTTPGSSFFQNEAYLIRRRSSSSMESDEDDVDTTGGSIEYEDSEEWYDSSDSEIIVSFSKKHPITPSEDPLKTKTMLKTSKKSQILDKSTPKKIESKLGQYKTFNLKKSNKSVTIELYAGRTNYYFTSELLTELTTVLTKASKEPECLVVLLKSSNNSVFSKGLDYKELISDKESVRKLKATKLAEIVKNFLECLANFRKVLIAGIQGECAGLAVTMLPLFDVVISSDDARFRTNYVRLGLAPEAGFLLEPPFVQNGLAGRMLLLCEKLTADEACRKGLVSTLCWPEKYQDTLKVTVADACEGSLQGIKIIKIPIMRRKVQQTEEDLEELPQTLVKEWISDKCQDNFKRLN